ncbi:unnamed protein product [Polarella glacialis]|uniref:Acyltransferase 3 domain-containing protein n=1 Tax=Polarella glacialis TaxID=89957 RepID=A0A813H2E0_POLGL|nr:unnamed protein product [Polarella glacialis]
MACGLCSSVTSFSTTAAIQWHRSSSVSFSRRLSRPCIIFVPIMGFVNFWVNKQDRISLGAACTDLARRLDRLCPGYYLALLWLYAFGAYQYDPLAYQLQALFLQTLLPIRVCGLVYDSYAWHGANSDGWFVSAAVVCAVCFPMLYNARPRRGWKATAMVLLAVLTFCASTRWMRSHIDLYMEGVNIYVWAPPRVLEFFAGMFFAQLADELPEHLKSWPGWPYISDLCLGMAFVVVTTSDSAMPTLAEDWFLTPLFGLHALSCSLTECSLARPDESVLLRGVHSPAASTAFNHIPASMPWKWSHRRLLDHATGELLDCWDGPHEVCGKSRRQSNELAAQSPSLKFDTQRGELYQQLHFPKEPELRRVRESK